MTWWEERDWSSSSYSQHQDAIRKAREQAKTHLTVETSRGGDKQRQPDHIQEVDQAADEGYETSMQTSFGISPPGARPEPASFPDSLSNPNSVTFYRLPSQPEYRLPLPKMKSVALRPSSTSVSESNPASGSEEGLFQHEALDTRGEAIRLLQVRPSTGPINHIECDIRTASTDDEYLCLSYVWGSPDRGNWIWINNKQFKVRQNLWSFLHILQQIESLRSIWIWIDALCIDQRNLAERTHQVQNMGLIYSKALKVVCWLGMDQRVAHFLRGWRPGMWDELHRFCAAPYWRRAWVTQEIALAKNITLMAMDIMVPLERLPDYSQVRRPEYRVLLQRITHIRGQPTDRSLVKLLDNFKSQSCELERDRIFSLRALCWEGQRIDVDYTITDSGLTWKPLDWCTRSFCLCSMYIFGDALATLPGHYSPNPDRVFYKHLVPHCAEVTLPLTWRTTTTAAEAPAPAPASEHREQATAKRSLTSVFRRTRKHKDPQADPPPVPVDPPAVAETWPFNSVTIQTLNPTGDTVSYKAVVCISLSSICRLFWGRLLLSMASDGRELEFLYTGYPGAAGSRKWHWNYTVHVAKDAISCVVRIPLEIWFHIIVRAADVDHKGCCPRIENIDEKDGGGGGATDSLHIKLSDKSKECCGIFDG
jgi:hypothetical protein